MGTRNYLETMRRLEEGIAELTDSDCWRDFLRAQRSFRQYSYRNALLIAKQCPSAVQVAGYHAWRGLGRNVRAGEHAIWILAPSRSGAVNEGEDGRVTRFVPVPVFDISQTEGRDLPEVCRRLEATDGSGAYSDLVEVAADLGFLVESVELEAGVNGECTFVERAIRIERRNSDSQRVKSLAHELAHAILHEDANDRSRAELEAESVAFVVCAELGIDSGEYSFGYVATWAGDAERARLCLERSCEPIMATSEEILGRISKLGLRDIRVA